MADDDLLNKYMQWRGVTPSAPSPATTTLAPPPVGSPPGTRIQEQSPAAVAAQTATGTGAGAAYLNDSVSAMKANARLMPLLRSIDLADKMKEGDVGPGTDMINHLKSFLISQTPEWLKNVGDKIGIELTPDKVKVADYNELKKYLTQNAQNLSDSLGPHTNQGLSTTITGQPNLDVSAMALKDLLRYTLAGQRMEQARPLAFSDTGLGADKYPEWGAKWTATTDPRVYLMDKITPEKRKEILDSIKDETSQNNFFDRYNSAVNNGVVSR